MEPMQLLPALELTQTVLHQDLEEFFHEYSQRVRTIDTWSEEVIGRLEEYCLRPGKALRPLMVAVGAALSRQESLEVVLQDPVVRRAMLIVELTHQRILMADDVADQDELRHDRPSFHVLFETDLAKRDIYARLSTEQRRHIVRSYTEVAGIWLQSITFYLLEQGGFSAQQKSSISEALQSYVYERTPAGWYILLDQNFETLDENVSEERFLKGLELVTGEYSFVGPLTIGSLLGSRAAELASTIANFGQPMGILFQLTDDRIGLFGDPEVTGKPVGNDIREGKKTLYLQYAYAASSAEQRQYLQSHLGKAEISIEEVEKVREIVRETGALAKTEDVIGQYAVKALQPLDAVVIKECRELLRDLTHFVAQRKK